MPLSLPSDIPFWRRKRLEEMDAAEWESLCDGCGQCCLVKLEDADTGAIATTDVGCTLLDAEACRCRRYDARQREVPDCVRLTPEAVRSLRWLPRTCAYRLVAEGRDLPGWHPLVCGDPEAVHRAGASVRGQVAGPEEAFTLDEIMERVTGWSAGAPD